MEQHHKANVVAKYLGVDTRTVKKACDLGELEYIKIAGVITIPESAIDAYRSGSKSRQVIALEKRLKELQQELERKNGVIRRITGDLMKEVEI